jgi:hypothetical protein
MTITGTTPPDPKTPIVNPNMHCPTCQRPRELKVDKACSLAGATKGVRIRPMATHQNRGRPRKKLRKDPRDVRFY